MSQKQEPTKSNVRNRTYAHTETKIDSSDPWGDDQFGLQPFAESMTNFVGTISHPFVLALNSPWGTGKTWFLRRWSADLRKAGKPVMYFSAWENDSHEQPLISLLGEMKIWMAEYFDKNQPAEVTKKLSQAIEAGQHVARRSLPILGKLLTYGILDLDRVTEAASAELAGKLTEDLVEDYCKHKSSAKAFRKQLESFAKTAAEHADFPLVIIIDELDRCRPNFAIEMLETAKHLFDVNNVVFVLGLDREALGHSVRAVYGAGIDGEKYLSRFIHADRRLPQIKQGAFSQEIWGRLEFDHERKTRSGKASVEFGTMTDLQECVDQLIVLLNLDYRTQHRVATHLALVLRSWPENEELFPFILGPLLLIRITNRELYQAYRDDTKTKPSAIVRYFWSSKPSGDGAFLFTDVCKHFFAFDSRESAHTIFNGTNLAPEDQQALSLRQSGRARSLAMKNGDPIRFVFDRLEVLGEFRFFNEE